MTTERHFTLYESYWTTAMALGSREAMGEFFLAMAEYFFTGEEPRIKRKSVRIAFESKRFAVEKSMKRSESTSKHGDFAAKRRGFATKERRNNVMKPGESLTDAHQNLPVEKLATQPETETVSESIKKNIKKKGSQEFDPPDVADIEAYCAESGFHIDAHTFVDYYTANGWRMGRAPMRDWRAAVRSWCNRAGMAPPPPDAPVCEKCGSRMVPIRSIVPNARHPDRLCCAKCHHVQDRKRSA